MLTHDEAKSIIGYLHGKHWLIASILYSCGLRINEALQLKIKDIYLADNTLFVFRGKGRKDRYSILPHSLNLPIAHQIDKVKLIHDKDLR